MKIYALMMTYNQMDWLPWSIKQFDRALEFGSIDRVLIAEGGHSKKVSARSSDGSWEYLQNKAESDERYQIFDSKPFRDAASVYNQAQYKLLNHVCSTIDINDRAWIWCIHDDIFFLDDFLKNIRNIVTEADDLGMDMVVTNELCFYFNFKLHLERKKNFMLCRWPKGSFWKPITTPCHSDGVRLDHKKGKVKFNDDFVNSAFHFKYVKRPKRQEYRHSILASEAGAPQASIWHREVWKKADLNNLDEAYKKSREIYGNYGFEIRVMGKKTYQMLKTYNGVYPEVLEDHPYLKIDDIRKVK